jgi:hypothetical protein
VENQPNLNSQRLPESFPVAVMMERRPSTSEWVDFSWDAVGVSVGTRSENHERHVVVISEEESASRYLHEGFTLQLYKDECESYYYNLMSEHPRCYVVADLDEQGCPIPCLVSLSYDEASAYLEGEEEVYAVDIPPELYRWIEAYVLAHYVPEKKIKRKLTQWASTEQKGASS